jgi:hypothetical protein
MPFGSTVSSLARLTDGSRSSNNSGGVLTSLGSSDEPKRDANASSFGINEQARIAASHSRQDWMKIPFACQPAERAAFPVPIQSLHLFYCPVVASLPVWAW